jgi:hypothetical protein
MFAKIIKKVLIGAFILTVAYVGIKAIKKVFSRKSARAEASDVGAETVSEDAVEVKKASNGDYMKPRSEASAARYKHDYLQKNGPLLHEQGDPPASFGTDLASAYADIVEMKMSQRKKAAEGAVVEAEVIHENTKWVVPKPAEHIEVVNGIPQNEPSHLKKTTPGFFEILTKNEDKDEVSEAILRMMAERIFSQLDGFTMYPKQIQELVMKTARGFVPGTEEFRNAFGDELKGIMPRGVLVPKRKPLMLPAQEEAEIRRFGWHKERPFEAYHFEGWREYHAATRLLYKTEIAVLPEMPVQLPRGWEERVRRLVQILSDHIEGFMTDEINDEATTLLTVIIAMRNEAWGLGGEIPYPRVMALFKYAVFCFRKILYTTYCQDGDYEEAADAFEELLELITIRNPWVKTDYLMHTPMIRIEN